MFLRVINDWHLFGVNPTGSLDDLSFLIDSSPYPVFLNGDVVDICNSWKKDLPAAFQILILLIAKAKRKGGAFIRGNHTCNAVNEPDEILLDNRVLITHGDIFMWGKEKSDKFRGQEPGAGWFKRKIISSVIDELRRFWTVRPNDTLRKSIREAKLRYPQLTTVILSHSHPHKNIFFSESNIFCVITQRGYSDLEVNNDGSISNIKV